MTLDNNADVDGHYGDNFLLLSLKGCEYITNYIIRCSCFCCFVFFDISEMTESHYVIGLLNRNGGALLTEEWQTTVVNKG